MARYFEQKLKLFGEDKLVRRITLDDMTDEDMEVAKCGCLQVLPKRDRDGRVYFFHHAKSFKFIKNPENFVSSKEVTFN